MLANAGPASAIPFDAGSALARVERTITQERIDAYRAASGDNNPLHHDAAFAAATAFGGIIAHGMLTLALVSEMMAASYGEHWLRTGGLRVRFRGAAYPGDCLETVGAVSKCESTDAGHTITCNVSVQNAATGDRILSGTATLTVNANEQQSE